MDSRHNRAECDNRTERDNRGCGNTIADHTAVNQLAPIMSDRPSPPVIYVAAFTIVLALAAYGGGTPTPHQALEQAMQQAEKSAIA